MVRAVDETNLMIMLMIIVAEQWVQGVYCVSLWLGVHLKFTISKEEGRGENGREGKKWGGRGEREEEEKERREEKKK